MLHAQANGSSRDCCRKVKESTIQWVEFCTPLLESKSYACFHPLRLWNEWDAVHEAVVQNRKITEASLKLLMQWGASSTCARAPRKLWSQQRLTVLMSPWEVQGKNSGALKTNPSMWIIFLRSTEAAAAYWLVVSLTLPNVLCEIRLLTSP